ncbi:MAG TPA: hypothetical protein PKA88_09035 [Polyangiaceae bacterium]|nr:hypothetical protein [Polyangiaceae bacterium]
MLKVALSFGTPRKLPKPKDLSGRVVVVDLAFAGLGSGFDKVTLPFIEGLGERLAAWVDHHDHDEHARFASDPRFVLAKKSEHGACPEMVTPELVKRIGAVDTIVCHTDFDGLASAAKWIREGIEPYPGCDDDARAVDTRIGTPSKVAVRFDRALRAKPRDAGLFGLIVRHLSTGLTDASLWQPIDEAAAELIPIERETRRAAEGFEKLGEDVVIVDVAEGFGQLDKTLLLLIGQERARIAIVLDQNNVGIAAPFDSGLNFLQLLGLSGGMPTRVSVPRNRLDTVLVALGLPAEAAARYLP